MSTYAKARLEGRALEHALAQDKGYCIRMAGDSGKFDNAGGPEARVIRRFMAERVDTLLSQLAAHGLHRSAGESPVVLPNGDKKSVDLRCWFAPKAENCLLELKWTRQNLQTALVVSPRFLALRIALVPSPKVLPA